MYRGSVERQRSAGSVRFIGNFNGGVFVEILVGVQLEKAAWKRRSSRGEGSLGRCQAPHRVGGCKSWYFTEFRRCRRDPLGSSERFVCHWVTFCHCWCDWVTVRLETAVPGGDAELGVRRRGGTSACQGWGRSSVSVSYKACGYPPLLLLFTRNELGYMKQCWEHWKYIV